MRVNVRNPRNNTVYIVRFGVVRPSGRRTCWSSPEGDEPIPCRIAGKDQIRFWVPLADLANMAKGEGCTGHVALTVEVQDSMDNVYTNKFEIDVENPVTY